MLNYQRVIDFGTFSELWDCGIPRRPKKPVGLRRSKTSDWGNWVCASSAFLKIWMVKHSTNRGREYGPNVFLGFSDVPPS